MKDDYEGKVKVTVDDYKNEPLLGQRLVSRRVYTVRSRKTSFSHIGMVTSRINFRASRLEPLSHTLLLKPHRPWITGHSLKLVNRFTLPTYCRIFPILEPTLVSRFPV